MDYEHLRNKLVEGYSNLSGRLQQITRYAMTHPNDMALETIAVIAKRTEVPPSSLIRLALVDLAKCRKCFSKDWWAE